MYQTVYDERQVTAYRIETETVYDQQTVTRYRPVYETEVRERRYTVARPVTETAEREERYKVLRPVWETQMRDASYDRVRDVVETSEREERYTVQRPVMETQEREERYTVQRPVVETAEREQCSTVVEPVTTYRTDYVDQGRYVEQVNVQPGRTYTALRWVPGTTACDPATGQTVNQPGGLAWIPFQGPAATTVNRVWQPNVVAMQTPQTTYVQRVVTQKVPYQVTRLRARRNGPQGADSGLPNGRGRASPARAGQHRSPGDRARRAASAGAGLQDGRRGSRSPKCR